LDITQVRGIGRDQVFWQGASLPSSSMDFSTADTTLTAGRYLINFKANIKDKSAPVPYQGYVVFTDSMSIKHVAASVGKEDSSDLLPVKVGSFNAQASAEDGDLLHVSFQVTSAGGKKPHQAYLVLTLVDGPADLTGSSAYFLSTRSEDGYYTNNINLLEDVARFSHASGTYKMTIFVGDAATAPLSYSLGEIAIKFPVATVPTYSLYAKSLLHTSDMTLKSLPEIAHVMRPDARRAPVVVATAFTAATWVPLVAFVVFLLSLKPDLSRLSGLSSFLWVLVLGGILVLYAGYWLGWQGFHFYATIKYICMLFPALLLVGRYALNAVMEVRHAQHAKKDKKV
jgi:hypothetical protein